MKQEGDTLTGEMSAQGQSQPVENGKVDGDSLTWEAKITSPMPMTLEFEGSLDGENLTGNVKLGAFGSSTFSGTPV